MTGYRIVHGGRGIGKSQAMRLAVAGALVAGKSVHFASGTKEEKLSANATVEYKCSRCPTLHAFKVLHVHYRWKRHRLIPCSGSSREGTLVVRPPVRENDFAAFEAKLIEMRGLQNGWNGYGAKAPNKTALSVARDLGSRLYAANLKPSRVVPIAIGGVALFMHGELSEDPRIVDIEVDNDGDMICSIGKESPSIFRIQSEDHLNQTIERILDYFEKPVDTEEFSK